MIHYKKSAGDIAFKIILALIMTSIVLLTLYPLWYIVVASFNEGLDFARGGVYFFPRKFTLKNYSIVFANDDLLRGFIITIARTVIGSVTHTLFTAIFAYGFMQKKLKFKKLYFRLCVFTMFVNGGMIPTYIIITELGFQDNFLVYIIPTLFSFWDGLIFVNFFSGIPDSIYESARIEGANEYRIFYQIVIPLSIPGFAAILMFSVVGHWNAYFDSMLYMVRNTEMRTVQHIIMLMIKNKNTTNTGVLLPDSNVTSDAIQFASMVVATIPVVIAFPFLQKYFIAGVLTGSVKE